MIPCVRRALPLTGLLVLLGTSGPAAVAPCRIQVVDRRDGWPVPLVELRTTHELRFVTDNAGVIAMDAPELLGRETWFFVEGHGYEVPEDGFGYRGVRLTPLPGGSLKVEVDRTILARRIGRLTGGGLFAESRKLGDTIGRVESGVLGCDSVQAALHNGRIHWLWGDTTLARYPLGIFHSSGATTGPHPLESLKPPLQLEFNYFRDALGRPREIARMPGDGPTWMTGLISLPDRNGVAHLVGSYMKVRSGLEEYEWGLAEWNEAKQEFERLRVLWTKSPDLPVRPLVPAGHPVRWRDEAGDDWVLFGHPFPDLKCPARYEAWKDPAAWEPVEPPGGFLAAGTGDSIKPHTGVHSGGIVWNAHRRRWVTVFMQVGGSPSGLGELWYAEATSPLGPWGRAVKVLSHRNYTFYNPKVHSDLTPAGSSILLFEGTYTKQFADRPEPTPRYDYNQILYRLDLDDPGLAPARVE